jgi:hypothetical protein
MTPTAPDLVDWTAGLIAGSIPIMGTGHFLRRAGMATAVAVLHATTIAFARCRRK